MARILLGVTRRDRRLQGARARRGWRPRPATRCASSRRRRAQRFVGAASFAGDHRRAGPDQRVGARPAARRVPRRRRARPRADRPPRAGRATPTCSSSRPRRRNTIAKLAARPRRQPADAPPRSPCRLPADRRARDERPRCTSTPATQANLAHAARARRDRARARHRLARARSASRASAGCPSRPSCWPRSSALLAPAAGAARRPARARHRRRHARADRRGPLRRQPLLAAGWASRSPRPPPRRGADVTVVAANVALPAPRRASSYVDVHDRRGAADACRATASRDCDVLLMAAAVADFRPADAHAGQAQEGRGTGGTERCSSSGRRTCSPASPTRRRPGQTLVGFAAEHGEGALAYAREKLDAQGPRRHRGQRRLGPGDRLRRAENEVVDHHRRRRAPRAAGGQGRGRGRHPGHALERSFIYTR